MHERIKFEYLSGHLIAIPLEVNGIKTRFLLDTGIGVTLISHSLANSLGISSSGSFSGKRMSGQEVSVPLCTVPAIQVGSVRKQNFPAGIFDMFQSVPGFEEINGILSLKFFENLPFTMDYPEKTIVLGGKSALEETNNSRFSVPVRIERDGPSISIFMEIVLPNSKLAKVEVDSGSSALILNSSFMDELGFKKDSPEIQTFEGKDETGNNYTRYFTRLNGIIRTKGAPEIKHENPEVVFQDIIYDGLIGDQFLKRFLVTYDIENSKLLFCLKG